jgi:hypothetical protein
VPEVPGEADEPHVGISPREFPKNGPGGIPTAVVHKDKFVALLHAGKDFRKTPVALQKHFLFVVDGYDYGKNDVRSGDSRKTLVYRNRNFGEVCCFSAAKNTVRNLTVDVNKPFLGIGEVRQNKVKTRLERFVDLWSNTLCVSQCQWQNIL